MKRSVFKTLGNYLVDVYWAVNSIVESSLTAVPYLVGKKEMNKENTEQYPDPISSKTADDLPPRTRGLLFNDIEKCTGCRECEIHCPVRCIRVEAEPAMDSAKIWVSTFDLDHAKCIFCGICTEVCVPGSLVHTREYEGAAQSLDKMVAKFGRGPVTEAQRKKWADLRRQIEDDTVSLT